MRDMQRRDLLALTAGGLATVSGCLDDASDPSDDDNDDVDDSPPFEIVTVDAPGSEAGTVSIPQEGQVMLVNFARTLCPTSEGLLGRIAEANADLEDGDVEVITVTDGSSGPQPTPSELADWWVEHGGNWTVGIDERGLLNDYYNVRGCPVLVAIDGDGEEHWRNEGGTGAYNMVSGVETALDAQN